MNGWLTLAAVLTTVGAVGAAVTALLWIYIPRKRSKSSDTQVRITLGNEVIEFKGESKDVRRLIDAWVAVQQHRSDKQSQESDNDPKEGSGSSSLTENGSSDT